MKPSTHIGLMALLGLAAVPAAAGADAHETSVQVEAAGGLARVGDPAGGQDETAPLGGGAVRFTWATRDWLAYELGGYGVATGSAGHAEVMFEGRAAELSRPVTAIGIEGGVTLRHGVTVVPALTLAIGPQLRLYPDAQVRAASSGVVIGQAGAERDFDLAARISAGLDLRVSARWVAGLRLDARRGLGLGDGSCTAVGGTVNLAYYWYPRWWTFEL